MIIPIRCVTCGKVIADKWEFFVERCKAGSAEKDADGNLKDPAYCEKVMNELGLDKMCCRRHMMGHVDLIETI